MHRLLTEEKTFLNYKKGWLTHQYFWSMQKCKVLCEIFRNQKKEDA